MELELERQVVQKKSQYKNILREIGRDIKR